MAAPAQAAEPGSAVGRQAPTQIQAPEAPSTVEAGRTWYATGYLSRWVNADLLDIPQRSFTGDIDFEDSNFVGVGLGRTLIRYDITLPGTTFALRGNAIDLELQGIRHFGDQTHWEGTIALMFRTGRIGLPGDLGVTLAVGEGLSYASEPPRLEGSERVEPTRLLNYLVFEAEFTHASWPGVYIVPRLHHRSGIFGVLAPRTSGSNFVGLGIRVDLR